MTTLTVFYAGATAYDHASHALTWAHHHVPLLAAAASLTGFAAGLWLRRTTADQRAWHDSTSGDGGPTDLDTCNAIWERSTANRRNTRKENPQP